MSKVESPNVSKFGEWCGRCGRLGVLKPHFCVICTKREPRNFASAKKAAKGHIQAFPSLGVVQDMEEGSELQGLRSQCLFTGSESGVLFNAKRGKSLVQWLAIKLGEKQSPPFNDYVKSLMEAGRRMEPIIAQYFWEGLYTEYERVFGAEAAKENLLWVHPGTALQQVERETVGATPDGLVVLYDGEYFRGVVVEIKYFASKSVIPDKIPEDYIAQIVLQQMTTGSNLCLFLCRVGEAPSETFYQWRLLVLRPHHVVPFRQKIFELGQLVEGQKLRQKDGLPCNFPKRFRNEASVLREIGEEMEVRVGEGFPQLLQALLELRTHALLLK